MTGIFFHPAAVQFSFNEATREGGNAEPGREIRSSGVRLEIERCSRRKYGL
jgi:hypothetical protein